MSSGTNLQEMEVGTQVSKTAVNANAAPAQPLPKEGSNASNVSTPGNQAQVEDLGGPTPDNYRSDDNSAKLKEEDLKIIEGIDLAEVCITSMVEIEMSTTGETSVETSKATGNKCPVCWKINTSTCKRHG